tara:strand:- start:8769 stop:9053 length:285 start_codon:yes stop_codon:yes gene_type:complete
MKLKDVLNESPKNWSVGDGAKLKKTLERNMKAMIAITNSSKALVKTVDSFKGKPQSEAFEEAAQKYNNKVEDFLSSGVFESYKNLKEMHKNLFG